MGSSSTSTVLLLLLFASFYVISLSTYTYISSLSNVNLKEKQNENRLRVKRKTLESEEEADYWTRNISLHKCCAVNQYLNEKYQCQDAGEILPLDELIDKLEDYVVDEFLNKTFINPKRVDINRANQILELRDENAFIVSWNSSNLAENYAFAQEDLSLLQLYKNKTKILNKFSTNSYCLDFFPFSKILTVFVNPCAENLCLQKCCPTEYYYNTIKNKCVKDVRMPDYVPTFHIDDSKIEAGLPYYLLEQKLKCDTPYFINKVQVNNITSAIFIQEDGTLQAVNGKSGFYNKQDYCTDLFSDGIEQNTFVGGFTCPLVNEIVNEIKQEYDCATTEGEGENENEYGGEEEGRQEEDEEEGGKEEREKKERGKEEVDKDEGAKEEVGKEDMVESKERKIEIEPRSPDVRAEGNGTNTPKIFFFELAGVGFAIILFFY